VAGFIGSPPMNFVPGMVEKKGDAYIFKAASFDIPVPADLGEYLANYVGKEVNFGIRPEDVWDTISSDWIREKVVFESTVDFREIIGAETYVYVHVGQVALTSRVNGLFEAAPGSKFNVVINLRKVHFFDPATQKAII
jgi:multiple sugar transport system ATP-binding protein